MSEWTEKPGPVAPARASSSMTTAEKPKSPPGPPYSSGVSQHSRPGGARFLPRFARDDSGALPLSVVRGDLAGDEAAHLVAERLVLGGVGGGGGHGSLS